MAKITIVDSDESNISSLTAILEQKGHTLGFQTTSAGLMNALQKKQPDMIIVGIELDGSDGRELTRFLQMESPYKDIPVILTSPFFHNQNEIRSFYCDDMISLPFDATTINASVEALLAKEQTRMAKLSKAVN